MDNTQRLAQLIGALAPRDGNFELGATGVSLLRRSSTSADLQPGVFKSSACIVAQGAKRVLLNQEIFDYDEAHLIVSSVDVPVASKVVRASPETPFLCLRVDLDPARIAPAVLKVFPEGLHSDPPSTALGVTPSDPRIFDAAIRFLEALADPKDAQVLAPLAYEELLIRLLRGPLGPRIAQFGVADSGLLGVSRAVTWLRSHYEQAIKIEDLARIAHMSVSSFHHHFRVITAQSPLQYQKALRLQEARNLMLTHLLDAGRAAQKVGYVSPSQFSREYGRYFGHSPTKDIAALRVQLTEPSEASAFAAVS